MTFFQLIYASNLSLSAWFISICDLVKFYIHIFNANWCATWSHSFSCPVSLMLKNAIFFPFLPTLFKAKRKGKVLYLSLFLCNSCLWIFKSELLLISWFELALHQLRTFWFDFFWKNEWVVALCEKFLSFLLPWIDLLYSAFLGLEFDWSRWVYSYRAFNQVASRITWIFLLNPWIK